MRRPTPWLSLAILFVLLFATGTVAQVPEGSSLTPEQAIEDLLYDASIDRTEMQQEIIDVFLVLQDDDVVLVETGAGIRPLDLRRLHELLPIAQLILTVAPELEEMLLERYPDVRTLLDGANLVNELDGAGLLNEIVLGGEDLTIADLDLEVLESALRSCLGEEELQERLAD